MLQQKSKKFFVYIFLFFLVGTFNNKNLSKLNFPEINDIYVTGLNEEQNLEVLKSLQTYKINSLFLLNRFQIEKLINNFNHIENYSVFKKYPSSLKIELSETRYLAHVTKDDKKYLLGSNGKLIKTKNQKKILPYFFGSLNIDEFFELKRVIDKLNFDYRKIKNIYFFPSGRWDLEINSGILIRLSGSRLEESLKLSIRILEDGNFRNIKTIDVRQLNQVIVNE